MKLINKIKSYASKGFLATAIATSGCSILGKSVTVYNLPKIEVSNPLREVSLPGGYTSSEATKARLEQLTGVISGDIAIKRTQKRNVITYHSKGEYKENPLNLRAVIFGTDIDGDKFITGKEAAIFELYLFRSIFDQD